MKKKLKIGIGVAVFAVIASIVTFIIVSKSSSKQAEEAWQSYADLINNKDYAAMYNMLTDESKKKITEEDFTKRNKNIYEGIGASDIKVEITNNESESGTRTLSYKSSMQTAAGEIDFENSVETLKEDGEYKINWSSNLIFPELDDDCKVRIETKRGKRGDIVDRAGTVIATDGVVFNIGIVPGKLDDKDATIDKIASLLSMSKDDINKKLNASYVTPDTFVPLKLISQDDPNKDALFAINGVQKSNKTERIYPLGEKAAHLTGYVQAITAEELEKNSGQGYTTNSVIGKAGLEKLFEEKLRGVDGAEIYIIDSNGTKKSTVVSQDAKDGETLKVTIDTKLQTTLYDQFEKDKGASVAMNPTTGEVLALVSTPSYNPNDFVLGMSNDKWNSLNDDKDKPMFNRFKASLTPGSTFKPITAAIGLNTNSLDPNEDKKISGLSWQKDNSWGDYKVTRVESYDGASNLENALIYSDNIYFAEAALGIGKENMQNGLNSLGFNEEMDFPFRLTKSTFSQKDEIATDVQLADSGYGQGQILVNPVHLASIYSMFVNNGSMVKPYLEYKENPKGEMWKENVISQDAIKTVSSDMKQIIENPHGTGHAAQIPGLSLIGKTGTAEIKDSQDDTNGTETGWFVETTTDRGEKNLLVVGMAEDAKDKGGSHYVIPKVKAAFDTLK